MRPSNQETASHIAVLCAFFEKLADGELVSWLRVEHETGVAMDLAGRALARRALAKLRRPYEAIRGEGVRMSSAEHAIDIVRAGFAKVGDAARRADKTRARVQERHFEQMGADDQKRMLAAGAFFGAVSSLVQSTGTELVRVKKG